MIVYLSGPTGPVTYPPPDTDSDQGWRIEAHHSLKNAGHSILDITKLSLPKHLPSNEQMMALIYGMVLASDAVIAHAIEGSWQSQYELETASVHRIPIHGNVVGMIDPAAFRSMWTYPSMSAAIQGFISNVKTTEPGPRLVDIEDELENTFNEACANTLKVLPSNSNLDQLPRVQYLGEDCGYDLIVLDSVIIGPDTFFDVDCGISLELPPGYWGFITGRSSTFRQKGLLVLPGVIDNGYRGPIFVGIFNTNKRAIEIVKGERLAQLILIPMATFPVEVVGELSKSRRGDKGFGSTGA